MFPFRRTLTSLEDRGPMRVMFVITCMPVGGAETLLVELIRKMDRSRFAPELCCLKYPGPLGEMLAGEIPVHGGFLHWKYDPTVLGRLVLLMHRRRVDAVVTVGTGGDKMFWGRLAAWLDGVPVIASALHSTGLPDHVEWPNRLLAPITDAFIGVAESHGHYLADHEGCSPRKIWIIPNGVDVEHFHPRWPNETLRAEWQLPPGAPVAGIVAALRPEKHHELFLESARLVHREMPEAHFLVVGDGPRRAALEGRARDLGLDGAVHFVGTRRDVPEVLSLIDVFVLTSRMEANPVSILEAMACEKPVVAPGVGSIAEVVIDGLTGYVVPPGDASCVARRIADLFAHRDRAETMGRAGREEVIGRWSVARMVRGYEELLSETYQIKAAQWWNRQTTRTTRREPAAP